MKTSFLRFLLIALFAIATVQFAIAQGGDGQPEPYKLRRPSGAEARLRKIDDNTFELVEQPQRAARRRQAVRREQPATVDLDRIPVEINGANPIAVRFETTPTVRLEPSTDTMNQLWLLVIILGGLIFLGLIVAAVVLAHAFDRHATWVNNARALQADAIVKLTSQAETLARKAGYVADGISETGDDQARAMRKMARKLGELADAAGMYVVTGARPVPQTETATTATTTLQATQDETATAPAAQEQKDDVVVTRLSEDKPENAENQAEA